MGRLGKDRAPGMSTRPRRIFDSPADLDQFISASNLIGLDSNGFLTISLLANGGAINNSGELEIGGPVARWRKYTAAFGDFAVADTTGAATLFSLPAGGVIEYARIKHSTQFAGTGITALVASVGVAGETDKYSQEFDLLQATGDNVEVLDFLPGTEGHAAAANILLTLTATGADLDQLSAGNVDVWVKWAAPQAAT